MNTETAPRRISLNLTDDEVKDLTAFAIRGAVTVGSLIEDFIADLTASTRSGGSDEKDLAREWYNRRDYQHGKKYSFSVFLVDNDNAQRFFSALDELEYYTEERDNLEEYPEDGEPGELEEATFRAEEARADLEKFLEDYRRSGKNTDATLEDIISDAKAHETELIDHSRGILESEPTEGDFYDTRSAAATRTTATPATVGTLKRLEDETYTAYGVNSKPAGLAWVNMVLDIAWKIITIPGLLDAITKADLDQLTEENYHTARHAAEVVQRLQKYTV